MKLDIYKNQFTISEYHFYDWKCEIFTDSSSDSTVPVKHPLHILLIISINKYFFNMKFYVF